MNSNLQENHSIKKDHEENAEVFLVSLFKFLIPNFKEIFLITSIFALASIGYALSLDNYYSSKVTMIEASDKASMSGMSSGNSGIGGFSSLIGLNLSQEQTKTVKALAVANSRTFIEEFIMAENLLEVIFEEEWDSVNKSWLEDERDLHDGYLEFKDLFQIDKDKKTTTFELSVSWKDPKLAAKWANSLFVMFNEDMRMRDKIIAQANIDYLESQVEKVDKVVIKNLLFNMIESQSNTKMLANAQAEYVFESVDKAVVAKERSEPQRRKIVVFATFIGFMFSLIIIFIRTYVKHLKDIYKSINL